ncbi:MAG: hypothetical protein AB8B58_05600 [Roseobacter sp.]
MLLLPHLQHEMELASRTVNAMRLSGASAKVMDRAQVCQKAPVLTFDRSARYPIKGAVWQASAGTG